MPWIPPAKSFEFEVIANDPRPNLPSNDSDWFRRNNGVRPPVGLPPS